MERQEEYANMLEEYARQSDKNRDISLFLQENFNDKKHIMLIEEKKIEKQYKKLSYLNKETSLLEKVELIDFWTGEDGRTNKTR